MLRVIILLTAALLSINTQAQEIITCSHACQFNGPDKQGRIYAYESDRDAELALNKIMEYTGLPTNFELKATNVPNAAAALQGNKRYIFYNQSFMQRISKSTRSDWTAYSILAHEIGHHLSGHTLNDDQDRHVVELQADVFSGYILYQMGASQEEALLALNELADDEATSTHPSKYDRKTAVIAGWNKARRHFSKAPVFNHTADINSNYSAENNAQRHSNHSHTTGNQTKLSYAPVVEVEQVQANIHELGQTGMRIKVRVAADQLENGRYKCVAWFYDKLGKELTDTNGKYKSGSTQVSAGCDLEIDQLNAGNTTCEIFIPYNELHQGEGFNESNFKIGLFKVNEDNSFKRVHIENQLNAFEYFNVNQKLDYNIEYSRVEPQRIKAGKSGIEVVIQTHVNFMDSDKYMMVVWFYDQYGDPLVDLNNRYASNGQVVTYESFTFTGNTEMGFRLFIPYEELHLNAPAQELNYKIGMFRNTGNDMELISKEKELNAFTLYR